MAATSLIKLYGEFWNPDIIDWGARGAGNAAQFLGEVKKDKKKYKANFFGAQGIYILFDSFKPVYVGKAFSTSIGKRVRDHMSDRHAGRWDMFSWYSTCTFKITDSTLRNAGTRQLRPETVVNTLEALAILIADPALNRKRESLPNAMEVFQQDNPNPVTVRHYLETILSRLPDDE
ncbi:GIY-YIG nuclease family protein [Octadecabacter sp. CECT 8868]|uniref:GIY-YIG nuclease family protein n=1 Tax=Octadecabacter algicola TaxID=2909342 RepID=UPI001F189622|nr:GIY-YIG nuclease family protein [Octadecabacter algicola]MCF2904917.1 GIY-YIG nuclease family protein [Octadecabacter algicola]